MYVSSITRKKVYFQHLTVSPSPTVSEILRFKLESGLFSHPSFVWRRRSEDRQDIFWMKLISQQLEGWCYRTVKIA